MKKFILTFLILSIALFLCLVATTFIPRETVQEHLLESLTYSYEKSMSEEYTYPTFIDHYADEMLLNIIYYQNPETPFSSVLLSPFYMDPMDSSTLDLINAIQNDAKANQEYSRYWHGSIVLLKPLLVFFSLEQIYLLFTFLFYLLWFILIVLLFRNKHFTTILFLGIAFFMTNSYVVPFCFEYLWTYLLTLILSILVLKFKNNHPLIPFFFFSFGILTCFFDFLTTETLVFTLPLFLILLQKQRDTSCSWKEQVKLVFLLSLAWGAGYLFMWLFKWGLAFFFLKIDFTESILLPLKGRTILPVDDSLNFLEYSTTSALKNITCLAPFFQIGIQWTIPFLLLIIGITLYLSFKKSKKIFMAFPFFLMALFPYLRYLIIIEHSYTHDFFTYRAQLSSILAILFIFQIFFSKKKERF